MKYYLKKDFDKKLSVILGVGITLICFLGVILYCGITEGTQYEISFVEAMGYVLIIAVVVNAIAIFLQNIFCKKYIEIMPCKNKRRL